jgi:hypothetical protein
MVGESGPHRDRCADGDIVVKRGSHMTGHTHATVGGRVAGQVAGVHAHRTVDSHEIRHGRSAENGARWPPVAVHADIGFHDIARPIDIIAVKIGDMVFVFLAKNKNGF